MFSLFSSSKKEGLSIIIDIQSGLVRGALVSFKKTAGKIEQPHIISIASQPINFNTATDGAYLTTMMLKSVEEIARLIAKDGLARAKDLGYHPNSVGKIHYVMSSPWIISQSKTVKVHYDVDTEITGAMVNALVDEERSSLLKKYKEENAKDEYEFDLSFIEQKIFDVRLNGYSIADFKGKRAKDMEISFAVTTTSKHIIEKIHSAVSRAFPKIMNGKHEEYHSALLLHYSALRSLIGNRDEFISLHVHGELTDIVVVKRGISSYLASFPFGTITLMRKLSAALKTNIDSGTSLAALFLDGKLDSAESVKVKSALDPLMQEWLMQCMNSLSVVGEKSLIPHLIYLSAHSNYDIFSKTLSQSQFEIMPFDEHLIDASVIFEKSSERSVLMGMYALALSSIE